jgi:predicted phosphodiesterase
VADSGKFDTLLKLTRHPIQFNDLCDRLDLSPRRCMALVDEARSSGIYVDVQHDHVGRRVPEPDLTNIPQIGPAPVVGGRHTIMVCSDWHFGSRYCMREHLRESIQAGYDAGARQVLCAGDILDGAHPDRIHELSHYGMDQQTDDAFETLPQLPGLTYHCITGNHDGWYTKARGLNIGEFIESRFRRRGRTDLHVYGPARKTLMVGTVKVELWHPGKMSSRTYAGSYQLERHIDTAYEAGAKPQILVVGHLHRYIKIRRRGIHAMLAPCFQSPESEFSKELGGGVALGGLILSWELTADNTIRRFACEEIDYFVREIPEELRGVA